MTIVSPACGAERVDSHILTAVTSKKIRGPRAAPLATKSKHGDSYTAESILIRDGVPEGHDDFREGPECEDNSARSRSPPRRGKLAGRT